MGLIYPASLGHGGLLLARVSILVSLPGVQNRLAGDEEDRAPAGIYAVPAEKAEAGAEEEYQYQ